MTEEQAKMDLGRPEQLSEEVDKNSPLRRKIYRQKMHGGWLVSVVDDTGGVHRIINAFFKPDPEHWWKLGSLKNE